MGRGARMTCRALSRCDPRARGAEQRLTELWDYEQYGYSWRTRSRVKKGGRYFYVEKAGPQNQGILYGPPRSMRRPRCSSTRTRSRRCDRFARRLLDQPGRALRGLRRVGRRHGLGPWRVREVETGRDLPDLIGDTKFTGVSWLPDSSAFYYSRYPKGADGKGDDQQQVSVYRHAIGTAQADEARLRVRRTRATTLRLVTEDGRWLVFIVVLRLRQQRVHLATCRSPTPRSPACSTSGMASTTSSAPWTASSISAPPRRAARRA